MRAAWTACICCALILGVSFALSPQRMPRVPLCGFQTVTGWPCPGCGLTRSFCAISHGRWALAYRLHPFGYLFYGLAVLGVMSPAVERLRPGRLGRLFLSRLALALVVGALATMALFGVLRLGSACSVPGAAPPAEMGVRAG